MNGSRRFPLMIPLALAGLLLLLPAGSRAGAADAPTAEAREVTQYGITWTFDRPYPVGRYVTGDWFVVGPARVVSVSPAPTPGRHGSAVDPAANAQCYDDRAPCYDAAPRATFPLELKANQSLVSTASLDKIGVRTPDGVPGAASLSPIRTAAVLTCEAAPPSADAFRPAYVGTWREHFRAGSLRRDLLPRLKPPVAPPDPRPMERILERIWLDHLPEHMSREMHPVENMPGYGRELTLVVSEGALLVLLDDPDGKLDTVLLRYVQRGIDLYGTAQSNPKLWGPNGGHNSGRKWPILFAGIMLDHPPMQQVQAVFQEDQQTYYGPGFRGQKALWTIRPDGGNAHHEEVDPATWKTFGKGANDGLKAEAYRSVNGPTWVGQALAARLLGATAIWNHPAYFDYVDRWCAEEGPKASSGLAQEMWKAYRAQADTIGAQAERRRQTGQESSATKPGDAAK